MYISHRTLPVYIRPSLYNQVRSTTGREIILLSADNTVRKMDMNYCNDKILINGTFNAINYLQSDDKNISILIFEDTVVITSFGKETSLKLEKEVSHAYISPITNEDYLIVLYGDFLLLSYIINKESPLLPIEPLSFSSRCSTLDINGHFMCCPLADGTVNTYQLINQQKWSIIGTIQVNTLRITDVSIAKYPTIVLTTWEGNIIKETLDNVYINQKQLTDLLINHFDMTVGDCCGSFIIFDKNTQVYIISRSIAKELLIVDKDMTHLLFYSRFNTFFRGLTITSCSCVHAFTNHEVYSFYIPSVVWLANCPIHNSIILQKDTSINLCSYILQHKATVSLDTTTIHIFSNHLTLYTNNQKHTVFTKKTILDVLLVSIKHVLIAYHDEIVLIDLDSLQIQQHLTIVGNIVDGQLFTADNQEVDYVYCSIDSQRYVSCSVQRIQISKHDNSLTLYPLPIVWKDKNGLNDPKTIVSVLNGIPDTD